MTVQAHLALAAPEKHHPPPPTSRQVLGGAGQHADPQAQPGVQPRPVRGEPGLGILRSARWVAFWAPGPLPGLGSPFQPLGPSLRG